MITSKNLSNLFRYYGVERQELQGLAREMLTGHETLGYNEQHQIIKVTSEKIVIPAQAGIYLIEMMDPRLREDDGMVSY